MSDIQILFDQDLRSCVRQSFLRLAHKLQRDPFILPPCLEWLTAWNGWTRFRDQRALLLSSAFCIFAQSVWRCKKRFPVLFFAYIAMSLMDVNRWAISQTHPAPCSLLIPRTLSFVPHLPNEMWIYICAIASGNFSLVWSNSKLCGVLKPNCLLHICMASNFYGFCK